MPLCMPIPLVEIYGNVIPCTLILAVETPVLSVETSVHVLLQASVHMLPRAYLLILPCVYLSVYVILRAYVHVPPQSYVLYAAVLCFYL